MSDEEEILDTSGPVVRYTAKELFAQINHKLDVVLELVQGKASQEDHDALASVVGGLEKRIQSMEDRIGSRLENFRILAWVVGTGIAVAGIIMAWHLHVVG